MDSKQLMDSLADHLALYHSAASTSKPGKSQLRNNIIRWISSLTTHQRQAALTTVDDSWLAIVLQMHARIQKHGPGFFIVLPDVPVNTKPRQRNGNDDDALPSLCYRKGKGLLARVNAANEAERILTENVRVFSSTEGQNLCFERPGLDSVVVAEELVKDVDRFVAIMDAISNGEFLRSTGPSSASKWEELPWLKAKGYYSLAAFVANKLELSLRLSWLNSNGKKRMNYSRTNYNNYFAGNGHDTAKNGLALAGHAANVFWRKKGCVDWWSRVDGETKARAFKLVVTKAAKFEVNQLVPNVKDISQTEMQVNIVGNKVTFAGKHVALHKVSSNPKTSYHDSDFKCHSFPCYLCRKRSCSCNVLSSLYILQEVSSLSAMCPLGVPEDDNLFFSSLSSAYTVLDNIMSRVREIFAKVSKDSVELDLLREDNTRNHLNLHKATDDEVQKSEKRRKARSKKKKGHMSKQNVRDASPKQSLEDASANQMPCEEKVKIINTEVDSRKGIISPLTDSGMKRNNMKMEKFHDLICQEENKISPGSLHKELETEQSVSGMGDSQVKSNKHGRGRSKAKKRDMENLKWQRDRSNGKKRAGGDNCEQPQQQAAKIQESFSLLYAKCDGLIDGSEEDFCSQNINFVSSPVSSTNLCAVDNGRAPALHSITSDNIAAEVTLSKIDHKVNHDSSCGSACEKECLMSVINNHVLCKSDSSDINEGGTQGDSSSKSNIPERDKRDAYFLSTDCKSSSEFAVTSEDFGPHGRWPTTAINFDYPLHHERQNNLVYEDSKCVLKLDTPFQMCSVDSKELLGGQATTRDNSLQQQRSRKHDYSIQDTANFMPPTSYEWPGSLQFCFPSANRHLLPAATDRLHLDVDWNWRHHSQPSFVALRRPMVRNTSGQGGYHKRNSKSQSGRRGSDSIGYSLDAGFTPYLQNSFQAGCVPSNMELNGHMKIREDSKYEGTDDSTCDDLKYVSGDTDDFEGSVISEDEVEKIHPGNACNSSDYNQVFGGGVMYWNTAEYAGTGYSRPPSLSSEDSSWARHEDDLKLVIEDIVNLTPLPGPYCNGGVASPPTTFHSTFDQLCSGTPTNPGAKTGNDFSGKLTPAGPVPSSEEQDNRSTRKCTVGMIDGIKGESLPHPVLRPIVIPNMSNRRARNDLHPRESRSPCVPCNRREPPRLKRPPSPVVLCVPPAPPPPPPSPVEGFRNQRRFPNVRSGSSSPRHWGISGAEINPDNFRLSTGKPEVVSFAWRRKCITATPPMHSQPGTLLCDRLVAIPQLPDVALPLQSAAIQNNPALQASVAKLHNLLHDEIESFCKQVAAENLMRKPFINAALERVSRALQVLWPRSRTNIFGSSATGLALPTSDVDVVVCLPPVRNLEPIKEAGILEGRNGIKETCLQHAARYLADQEWVKSDSLKTIENTAIPIIMLVVEGISQHCCRSEDHLTSHTIINRPREEKVEGNISNALECENSLVCVGSDSSASETAKTPWGSKNNRESVRLDISFESPSHTGLKTTNLVRELIGRFPAIVPLALVLKQFLTDRSLDHSYSGGLSSYCLVLLITRFLQHEHHTGRPINQNLGSLFMDFLYFFGCVFDPRQMRVSIYRSGMYVNRDRGQSIDPLHIDDPLHQANNVGRNCFRIHQCIKAFADAHSILEKKLVCLSNVKEYNEGESGKILPKIIPSIADM